MTTKSLQDEFKSKIILDLQKELGAKNYFVTPRLSKVKVAVGIGKIARKGGSSGAMDEARIKQISENLAAITGQKPRIHKAKKAISNFKLRAEMPIGVSVTLRGDRMFDFVNKLVNIVLPRVRDFRGISPKSFDGKGNYSLGLKDYTVFPEVKPEDVESAHGVEITIVTTAKNNEEGLKLLTLLGFPFIKPQKKEKQQKVEMPEEIKAEIAKAKAEAKEADKKAEEKSTEEQSSDSKKTD